MRLQQRLEQANETNSRLNRTLEELVKECEEKQVRTCLPCNTKLVIDTTEKLAILVGPGVKLQGFLHHIEFLF